MELILKQEQGLQVSSPLLFALPAPARGAHLPPQLQSFTQSCTRRRPTQGQIDDDALLRPAAREGLGVFYLRRRSTSLNETVKLEISVLKVEGLEKSSKFGLHVNLCPFLP